MATACFTSPAARPASLAAGAAARRQGAALVKRAAVPVQGVITALVGHFWLYDGGGGSAKSSSFLFPLPAAPVITAQPRTRYIHLKPSPPERTISKKHTGEPAAKKKAKEGYRDPHRRFRARARRRSRRTSLSLVRSSPSYSSSLSISSTLSSPHDLTQHNMTKHSHAHTKTHKQARGPAPFASMP